MKNPTRTASALAGLALLVPLIAGCGADAPETIDSPSTEAASSSAFEPEENEMSPSVSPSSTPSESGAPAEAGWGRGPAPTDEALAVMEIKDVAGGEGSVTVTLDGVEYLDGVVEGKTVALVAMTTAAPADGPAVKLAAPIDGGGMMYASTPEGTDAISTYHMMQDYTETWVGYDVKTFHSGPFNPGMPEAVVQTLVIDEPGGALVFMQPDGHFAGPIELPTEDAGLPNESITRIHEIMDTHYSSGLLPLVEPV